MKIRIDHKGKSWVHRVAVNLAGWVLLVVNF